MNALLMALLLAASCRAAEFDRFQSSPLSGETVAVSSASAPSRAAGPAKEGETPVVSFADWGKLAEVPLGIAVGARPAWTRVEPKRAPWSGPKRLEPTVDSREYVEREMVDGVEVLRHKSFVPGGGLVSVSPAESAAQKSAVAALSAAMTGSVGARVVSHDESRPFGSRNLWEISMPDGSKRYVRASPLVLDLKGGGVRTSARTVLYDLYGTGHRERMEWINDIAPGMGLLVFDAAKDGRPGENGLGLFGDSTDLDGDGKADGYLDGFKALRAFVAKAVAERVIAPNVWTSGILDTAALRALEKAYGLKIRVGGLNAAPVSLAAAGVRGISITGEKVETQRDFDHQGNDCARQEGAVFLRGDGSTGVYEDVWFKPKNDVMVVAK